MKTFSTSRIAAIAAALTLLAGPVLAQTSVTARAHHANYGDDAQYRQPASQTRPPATRSANNGGYHRPHHADD